MSNANFVQCQLSVAIAAGANTITLAPAVHPFQLPPEDGGVLILADSMGRPTDVEIISYASRAGQVLSGVQRAQEGTAARAWPIGSYCYQALTAAGLLAQIIALIDDASSSGNRTWSAQRIADRIAQLGESLGTAAFKNVVTSSLDRLAGRVIDVGWMGHGASSPTYTGSLNSLAYNAKLYANGAANGPGGEYYGWVDHSEITPGQYSFQNAFTVAGDISFRTLDQGVWSGWFKYLTSKNQFPTGPTKETARAALGIIDGSTCIDIGDFGAGNATLSMNLNEAKIFRTSFTAGAGTATLNFIDVPASETEVFAWHVQLTRGGLKTLTFQRDGVAFTPVWSAGVAPVIPNTANTRAVLMFEKWPGSNSIYAMLVDAGAV